MQQALAPLFAVGALSSVGPCGATRVLALAPLIAGRRATSALKMCFACVAGICVAYAIVTAGGTLLAVMMQASRDVYLALAAAFGAGGIIAMLRPRRCSMHAGTGIGGTGGAFVLGLALAGVASPCCAPVLAAILVSAAAENDPHGAAISAAAFGSGHAFCTFLAIVPAVSRVRLQHVGLRRAAQSVGGAIALALAAYYAVVA